MGMPALATIHSRSYGALDDFALIKYKIELVAKDKYSLSQICAYVHIHMYGQTSYNQYPKPLWRTTRHTYILRLLSRSRSTFNTYQVTSRTTTQQHAAILGTVPRRTKRILNKLWAANIGPDTWDLHSHYCCTYSTHSALKRRTTYTTADLQTCRLFDLY